jgi:hypothetical protein
MRSVPASQPALANLDMRKEIGQPEAVRTFCRNAKSTGRGDSGRRN